MGTLTIIKTDGTVQELPAETVNMEELKVYVGGWLERVKVRYKGKLKYMWCNEEGHPLGLPINAHATRIYQTTYPTNHTIAGDVVIVDGVKIKS